MMSIEMIGAVLVGLVLGAVVGSWIRQRMTAKPTGVYQRVFQEDH